VLATAANASNDNGAVLVKPQIDPKCFQKVATNFKIKLLTEFSTEIIL